ncbi:hypothetical protein CMT37_18545 [Elizabethkingia anophelis]|nr:hypothetical protein [Elizabethkingia anophelis]
MSIKTVDKLRCLVKEYLHCSIEELSAEWGTPGAGSDMYNNSIWIYHKRRLLFFHDEIAFIIEKEKVVDIALTECFLWMDLRSVFYFKGQENEYRVDEYFKSK